MRHGSGEASAPRVGWAWLALILLLLALRLPSLVQPAGGDQGLYGYAGQRILAGEVMYRDVWDQKPPAIASLYALLWRISPTEAIVPAADLAAAGLVAWLLIILGRRHDSAAIGFGAAAIFLLLGDPYLQRQSGIYVRSQCEPFIALAITAALVLLARPRRQRAHLIAAGVALGSAFWLKYNAAPYAIALVAAIVAWPRERPSDWRLVATECAWAAVGFVSLAAIVLAGFAAAGALVDLRLATIDYNIQYSNETYGGGVGVLRYLARLPLERAALDPLWYAGGVGAVLLIRDVARNRSAWVVLAWLAAAVLAIAINGSRGLPNYFVQANPALALAASAGLATLAAHRALVRAAVAAVLVLGLWRVGSDAPVFGWRLASMPGLIANARFDLDYARGRIDRETYLRRFTGQKHDPHEIEVLVDIVRRTTDPGDHIFVFGFSGGSVSWKSGRVSSSRFFWSRPIIIGFAARRHGYGWEGLLEDLRRHPPALVALQKEEWRSRDFFMQAPALRAWLEAGYVLTGETPEFSVWRPRTGDRE